MWFRYGVSVLLVCSTSCSTLSSDDEISRWALKLKAKTEPVTDAVDLTPSFLKPVTDAVDLTPSYLKPVTDAVDLTPSYLKPVTDAVDLTPTFLKPVTDAVDLTPTFLKNSSRDIDLNPTYIPTHIECQLEKGSNGICTPYFQCDINKTIIQDGKSLLELRRNKICPSYFEVCCEFRRPSYQFKTYFDDENKQYGNSPLDAIQPSSIDPDECGWTNIQPVSPDGKKTHQGPGQAMFMEFRWMIAIIKKRQMSTTWVQDDYIGGGSLIHPSVVITAAHLVNKTKSRELKCRAGEFNIQTESEAYKFQEQNVRKMITHPDYVRSHLGHDVALVFLNEPFNLINAPHIGLACLNKVLPEPNTECYTMGWGTNIKDKKYATTLKKLKMPLVSEETCQTMLRATRLGLYFHLHPSLTCAGGEEGLDVCYKDGGSPLVCPIQVNGNNVRYAIVGMVAYGIECGVKDRPGVYVKVPAIYSWVDKAMTDEKYGTVTYNI